MSTTKTASAAPDPPPGPRRERGGEGVRPPTAYVLRLYVAGDTPRSQRAIENLRQICDSDLAGRSTMEIIDILAEPQIAEDQRILATPLLIKEAPEPSRRLIGDLSNTEQVLMGLDIRHE
jgi:circadian clock protein KaiB